MRGSNQNENFVTKEWLIRQRLQVSDLCQLNGRRSEVERRHNSRPRSIAKLEREILRGLIYNSARKGDSQDETANVFRLFLSPSWGNNFPVSTLSRCGFSYLYGSIVPNCILAHSNRMGWANCL